MLPAGPLLTILAEQAVTGEPGPAPGGPGAAAMAGAGAAAAAAASRAAGTGPLAGIPGVAGADGVRDLPDDGLLGLMPAADRMASRAQWARLAAIAEFSRRRLCQQQAAVAARAREGRQAGQHATDEVAFETARTARQAGEQCWLGEVMASRLPRLMSRMGSGAIDDYRALIAARATADLSAEDAAAAGQILAAEAPGLTTSALSRRAWQVVLALDPEAAARRKKKARNQARVQVWREESGNAALAGRETDPADALAASARDTGDSPAAADPPQDSTGYFPEAADGYHDGGRHPGLTGHWRPAAGSGNPDRSWEASAPHGDGWQDGLRDDGYRDDENPGPPDDEDDGDEDDGGGNGNGGGDGGPGDGRPGKPGSPGSPGGQPGHGPVRSMPAAREHNRQKQIKPAARNQPGRRSRRHRSPG